jgi:hypothetical protein
MFDKLTGAEREEMVKDPIKFWSRYTPEWLEFDRMTDEKIMINADVCFAKEGYYNAFLLTAELLVRELKKNQKKSRRSKK